MTCGAVARVAICGVVARWVVILLANCGVVICGIVLRGRDLRRPARGPAWTRSAQGWLRSQLREPQPDLPGGGLRRIGAVHQVELGLQAEVAADAAGRGLLDRVGAAGQLAEGGDGARALGDNRDQRSTGDELQQALVETLAGVLGVVLLRDDEIDDLSSRATRVRPLRSIREMTSPTRRRSTPSGLIRTSVLSADGLRRSFLGSGGRPAALVVRCR